MYWDNYVRTGSVLAVSFNKRLNFRIGHCNGRIRRMRQQTLCQAISATEEAMAKSCRIHEVQQLVYWDSYVSAGSVLAIPSAVAEYPKFCPVQEQIPCQQISATESATMKSCSSHTQQYISDVVQQISEVSKMEIFSPQTRTRCCFPASTPGTDKLLLSIVAIPVDPLLYFSCSIVRKPGDVQVLRSANREKPLIRWQPEVLRILCRFLSTYVYYIIHDYT